MLKKKRDFIIRKRLKNKPRKKSTGTVLTIKSINKVVSQKLCLRLFGKDGSLVDAVTSSWNVFAKHKLSRTFNFDKQEVIDSTKLFKSDHVQGLRSSHKSKHSFGIKI